MFDSAKKKIERADYHITDVEGQFAAFIREKPHAVITERDPDSGRILVRMKLLKPFPTSLALVIGDAIHNLRTALDHLTWEAVGLNGTQNRYLQFPTGGNRVDFEATCKGIKTPDQWVKDAICALQAFPGGKPAGNYFYEIAQMDNADKHTVVEPIIGTTGQPPITVYDGMVIYHMENNVFMWSGEGTTIDIGSYGPGARVQLHDDKERAPSILIRKATNGHYVPGIPFLRIASDCVRWAIEQVEAAKP